MWNSAFLKEIVRKAGQIAQGHSLRVTASVKPDASYVTQADLEVQDFLRKALEAAYPRDGFIGEENALRRAPKSGGRTWILDPIDGTSSFVWGLPGWGVSVGLFEEGRPRAGFFFMPATGDLFYTSPDGAVLRNERPTRLKPPNLSHPEASLLVGSRFPQRYELDRSFAGKVRNLGSTAAHLCYAATGASNAALLDETHLWDFAAGWPMMLNNGGVLRYLDGSDVNPDALMSGESSPQPILAAPPETWGQWARLIRFRE